MTSLIKKLLRYPARYLFFLKDWQVFSKKSATLKDLHLPFPEWKDRRPLLGDSMSTTKFDAHYIYHVAWAIRVLRDTAPQKHIDISSSLNFCTTASAIVPIDFYDYRPANINLPDLKCGKADLTDLDFDDGSIESLSCMHTIEHIGLGRYGDEIDPLGDRKAIKELLRVLSPQGQLLMVLPVGMPKVIFNAHRIYGFDDVLELFAPLKLESYTLITDQDEIINAADRNQFYEQSYGCGCFLFRKSS